MKIARYALAALGLIAFLTPTAKADSFVYQVTSNFFNIDVIFDLPTFQEVVDTTTFIKATSSLGPITEFGLSGNSTGCFTISGGGSATGPCWTAVLVPPNSLGIDSPSFSSPGTFTNFDTTVTITEVSTVPEPSSLALIPLGLVALLVMRKRMI
jgi:hypothetical protein